MEIEHLCGRASHGPVSVFLTDSGRIGFVCQRDGAYWEGDMPQLEAAGPEREPAGPPVPARDPAGDDADRGGSGEFAGRLPGRKPPCSSGEAEQPLSREEAFQIARYNLQ